MECHEAKQYMSDYLEQFLSDADANLLTEHLADCGECRSELDELRSALRVMHELPRREPVFDLWQEFAPKFAEIRAEMKLSRRERINLYFTRLFGAISEGWRIFALVVGFNIREIYRPASSGAD